jgi:hypothetical protein
MDQPNLKALVALTLHDMWNEAYHQRLEGGEADADIDHAAFEHEYGMAGVTADRAVVSIL